MEVGEGETKQISQNSNKYIVGHTSKTWSIIHFMFVPVWYGGIQCIKKSVYDPVFMFPLLGIYVKKPETLILKNTWTPISLQRYLQ